MPWISWNTGAYTQILTGQRTDATLSIQGEEVSDHLEPRVYFVQTLGIFLMVILVILKIHKIYNWQTLVLIFRIDFFDGYTCKSDTLSILKLRKQVWHIDFKHPIGSKTWHIDSKNLTDSTPPPNFKGYQEMGEEDCWELHELGGISAGLGWVRRGPWCQYRHGERFCGWLVTWIWYIFLSGNPVRDMIDAYVCMCFMVLVELKISWDLKGSINQTYWNDARII